MIGSSRDFNPTDDYDRLIKHAEFVAGVIESRGSFGIYQRRQAKDKSWDVAAPGLSVNSTNGNLLKALQRKYGGYFQTRSDKGSFLVIQGRQTVLRNNSFRWSISDKPLRDLMVGIKPNFLTIKTDPAMFP